MPEEHRSKTQEEIYLEELYRAMDTGDVPEGMIPPQIPSLQQSNYEFHRIHLPVKTPKTPPMRICTACKILSTIYLVVGALSFFSITADEGISLGSIFAGIDRSGRIIDIFVLLSWVFCVGAVLAAVSAAITVIFRLKKHIFRKVWPFAVFALCVVFAAAVR